MSYTLDTSGAVRHPAIPIKANAQAQNSQATLTSPKQKQRSALLLTAPEFNGEVRKTLFIAFATTHEEETSHGWVVAVDLKTFQVSAAWCTSPNGAGVGVWQAGQGPAADENNAIFLMTGNYGVQDQNKNTIPPRDGDRPESPDQTRVHAEQRWNGQTCGGSLVYAVSGIPTAAAVTISRTTTSAPRGRCRFPEQICL